MYRSLETVDGRREDTARHGRRWVAVVVACEALWGTADLGRPAGRHDKTTPFYSKLGTYYNDSTESQKTHNTTMSINNILTSKLRNT